MFNKKYWNHRLTKKTGVIFGAIALGLTMVTLPACDNTQEIEGGEENVTTEDLSEGAEDVAEEMVTVRSPIQETVGEAGFLMESEGEPILVLNASGVPFVAPVGETPVQATGEPVQFVLADIESEYGLDLDPDLFVDYEEQPAIIAQSLALAPTPEDLALEPQAFYDQAIAIEGEARDILSPNALTLFEDGWVDDLGLLVIGIDQNLESPDQVDAGEFVTITGVAQPFDANLIQEEAGLDWDENEISEFEARYADRPVVIADGIYPSALEDEE